MYRPTPLGNYKCLQRLCSHLPALWRYINFVLLLLLLKPKKTLIEAKT